MLLLSLVAEQFQHSVAGNETDTSSETCDRPIEARWLAVILTKQVYAQVPRLWALLILSFAIDATHLQSGLAAQVIPDSSCLVVFTSATEFIEVSHAFRANCSTEILQQGKLFQAALTQVWLYRLPSSALTRTQACHREVPFTSGNLEGDQHGLDVL